MGVPILRPFQADLEAEVHKGWAQGAQNIVMKLDTGGGKTVTLSSIVRYWMTLGAFICVMAHRTELVGQLSLTLARYGIRHNIIGSDATRRGIIKLHVEELGVSWIDPMSPCTVASVDTIIKQTSSDFLAWAARVTKWVVDEGHHVVLGNKWHRAIQLFHTDALGLLPTATPGRADRKGLGRPIIQGDGVADIMVSGPPMRWLIEQGFLTDYRYICPPTDLQMLEGVGASGDWSTQQLRDAVQAAPKIIGDVVRAYQHYGTGKLGVTFSTDVETAGEITWAFQRAGIRAECLTGKTDPTLRRDILRKFKNREIMQIVAVDIISEGFDLPAIEVLNMARPTASLGLYMQQFGRALRTIEGKDRAIIIDHAGNLIRHQGPPDKPREWTLARQDKRAKRGSDAEDYKVCSECTQPFERFKTKCPHCGHKPEPAERSSPAHVDGDLFELAPEILAQLRAGVAQADESVDAARSRMASAHWSPMLANVQLKRHGERHDAQARLRSQMAFWGGRAKGTGLDDAEIHKLFYLTFGTSTLEAMAYHAKDALLLADRIQEVIA